MAPLFSVVMPAYNAAATLDRSIGSVLAQSFEDWELVITDDGSTDETRAICDRYAADDPRVKVETQPNGGTGAALNAGAQRARGEFIVQLGADDELLPDYCRVTASMMAAHPGFDIYSSNAYRRFPDGSLRLYHTAPRFEREFSLTVDDLLDESQIYGTAAIRTEIVRRVGGFRTEFYNEDYDLWLRAMMAGAKHIYTPEPLAVYTVVPGQKTSFGIRMRQEDARVLEDAIRSGRLTPEQVEHAKRSIRLLEQNVAFRKRVIALVGPRLAEPVFSLAHRLAWIIRPYRRAR